ncbi:Asp-tRNA(Asn)/Glu-tRNA(Gln) amidotransferase subunit GatC [Deinococcus pimensis]|uniref:Asp-tRNA(Asn)/Glu-tRNA(Gln) amidotransferase subunit GatC n=1 Tax=Deinococcus pimensis TaxID=309888 RepID=UPI00048394C4|nr:Asp-tRNA(Asn)/Glu-tRNA(Gln) amidotransferase subunit GatC [Deinococcus pimensis]
MIDAPEMEHLKKLARLSLTEEETAHLQGDLNRILGYFEKISGLDTDGVEEMPRPVALVNVTRSDEPGDLLSSGDVASVAVERQDGFFRVPRTVDQ